VGVGSIMAVFVPVSAVIRVIMGMAVPRAIRMDVVMLVIMIVLMLMLMVRMSTFNFHFTFAAATSDTHVFIPSKNQR
jgi:hypothetical protein